VAEYSFDVTDHVDGSLIQEVELSGLDDMRLTLGGGTTTALAGEAKIDSDAHVRLDPVTTSSTIDLEPVTVDSCVRLELGNLPATDVHTPYQQRWAVEVLGVELFALNVSGETTTSVRPARRTGTVLSIEKHGTSEPDCGCGGHKQQPHPVVIGD
jgi:hypothetical protein